MLTHLVLARGVSRDSSWNIYKEWIGWYIHQVRHYSAVLVDFLFVLFIFSTFLFFLRWRFSAVRSLFLRFSGRRMPSPADICFRCGKRGHWSSSCGRLGDGPGLGNYRNTTRLGSGSTSGEQSRRPDERQSTIWTWWCRMFRRYHKGRKFVFGFFWGRVWFTGPWYSSAMC